MFWTILILMVCFAGLACVALFLLGIVIGNWAYLVLGFLLAAGAVTVLIRAYKELTGRLDRIEEKLDRLAVPEPERPRKESSSNQ